MAHEVTCPGCSQTFEPPRHLEEPWLECPHCQAGVLNAVRLQRLVSPRLIWWMDVLGTLFLLNGALGTLVVGVALVLHLVLGGLRKDQPLLVCTFLGCTAVITIAGFLLLRASRRASRNCGTAGVLFVVLSLSTFLAFACVAVAVVTAVQLSWSRFR